MPFPRPLSALLLAFAASMPVFAQTTPEAASAPGSSAQAEAVPVPPLQQAPLPKLSDFMSQVKNRQRTVESAERDYIYRQTEKVDDADSKGTIKKSVETEYEVFWVNGVRVARKLKVDGKDLSPEDQKKENERIDKRIAEVKARQQKNEAEGKGSQHGGDEISFSRMVDLGDFTNEHREYVNGRPTIVVDYTGNPKTKTNNPLEGVFHELAGTVWIDEQDKVIQHLDGHFAHSFKIGGGLIASVAEGTTFHASFVKINNEAWLPQSYEAHGHARALLFVSFTGGQSGRSFDYRKFKSTSTISPVFQEVPAETTPPKP